MVILRPTRKLRSLLPTVVVERPIDTALGDWYVNRIVVERQPLLLLVSTTSLLSIVLPARDVRSLPKRLASVVGERLRRLGVDDEVIAAEQRAMQPVVVAATDNRSVLGNLVDLAKSIPFYFEKGFGAGQGLAGLEDWLQGRPSHAATIDAPYVFPDRHAPALLRARWFAEVPGQPAGDPSEQHA